MTGRTDWTAQFWGAWRTGILFALLFLTSTSALAQTYDPTEQPQIDFSEEANKRKPISASKITPVSLKVHWNLYKEVVRSGKSGNDQLNALRDDAISVGQRNLPATTFAAIRLVQDRHEQGKLPLDEAATSLKAMHDLSPALPHPKLARARLQAKTPAKIGQVVTDARDGWKLAFQWPDTRVPYLFNIALTLLLATVGASLVFLLAQLFRYFSVVSYDFVRLLPTGFSSNQGVILLLGAIIVPGLLLQSPLLSALILLMALSVAQQIRERVVTAIIFGLLIGLPQIENTLSDALTWSTGSSRELLQAQYTVCDDRCFDTLEARYRESRENKDVILDYTYWMHIYRSGNPSKVIGENGLSEEEIGSWPKSLQGYGYNLLGAATVAMAEPEGAIPILEKASTLVGKKTPAPNLNLLRAHQMLDDQDSAQAAIDKANLIDLDQTMLHLNLKRMDINSWLSVPALPSTYFWKRHRQANTQQVDLISRFWPYLAGKNVPLGWATYIGGVGLLLLLLTIPLPLRGVTSTPCPSCGLARDPEDGKKNGDHHFCMSCYRTYVAGASMDFEARVTSEDTLSQRRRLQELIRRTMSALLPGGGHATSGYGFAGFFTSICFFVGALLLWIPGGIWRAPEDLIFLDWMGFSIIGGVFLVITVCIGLYGAARDIPPVILKVKKFHQNIREGGDA